MHHQATCSPVEADDRIDLAIMSLLLDSPRPLAVAEVEREIGDHVAAVDGLDRLHRGGLIHRLDGGYVFASRSAVLADAFAR